MSDDRQPSIDPSRDGAAVPPPRAATPPPEGWKRLAANALRTLPIGRVWLETRSTGAPLRLRSWLVQRALGLNVGVYWPVHPSSQVNQWQNVVVGVETAPGMMPGCYVQGAGGIVMGDYTLVAAGVGIVSANHVPGDARRSVPGRVTIGSYCWLAMNSVVLPGVTLGDFTVVGAGAVVTKSFPEGHVVLAGNPARVIRTLDPATCHRHRNEVEYHGFIPAADFPAFRRQHLTL